MADNSAYFSELDAFIARMDAVKDQAVVDRIERKGLEAVLAVAYPAMVAATPVSTGRRGTTSLPVGALKAGVRARILPAKNGLPQAAVVDFGRNNHVARFVDEGTANAPAHPFIRKVVTGTRAAAEAAFVEEASAELDRYLSGR